ncbi:MAG: ABC transporter substrate-binding protein [Acidiphilium sp.]|nr:ABC transporter substrate-binding protein [Acidiphilium sp.]MDD4936311.1 ABC transporter substrate-binding protein [Acidiphilium sp.]
MCIQCDTLAHDLSHGCRSCDAVPARGIPRRRTLDYLMAGGLAAWLATQPRIAQAADDETVRLGYLPITDATALLVAYAKGFFKDEGLNAERPTLMRAWAPMVEAFAAGKFNLVHLLAPLPIWMRYNNHVKVKQIAWAHVNGSAITVGPHSNINTFADLGGKRVAVPFWYSIHNILLQQALANVGIEPILTGAKPTQKQCALEVLGPPDMLPALAAGKIDAYVVAEPFNAMGEVALNARILRFTGDMWENHPCCVACVPEAMVTKNPAWTQKVANALVRAEHYASAHKIEVAKLISRDGEGFLPMPAKVVERAMALYANNPAYLKDGAIQHQGWHDQRIDFKPYPYASAMTLIVNGLKTTKVAGNADFLAKLDPAFVQNDLVDERFVSAALAKYPPAGGPESTTRTEVITI